MMMPLFYDKNHDSAFVIKILLSSTMIFFNFLKMMMMLNDESCGKYINNIMW